MSAPVPHLRPTFEADGILSGEPVSAFDWQSMTGLANFCNGHGGMLVPWAAIGYEVAASGSAVFHFYVAPKARAVERVWCVNLRSGTAGATASVTCGSASAVTITPPVSRTRRSISYAIREPLSAKTSTAADAALTVAATGGAITVESVAVREQTRATLATDTTDYGIELGSIASRRPILDLANRSLSGVCDAYDSLDARRAGLFHWSTAVADPVEVTSGSLSNLFALSPPVLLPVPGTGDTTSTITIAAYAKVDSGSGLVKFTADGAGSTKDVTISETSFKWHTNTLAIDCEDLAKDDGRRSTRWEGLTVQADNDTATTLSIAAISVVRTTTPL